MEILKLTNLAEQTQGVISILGKYESKSYLLLLSGGQSPNGLYKYLSHSFNYSFPADVALTDERWRRQKFHSDSNELMIKNTGFLGRVEWEKSNWNPILSEKTTPTDEATRYSLVMESLFSKYGKNSVAIIGMGLDGHILGVLPDTEGVNSTETVIYYESEDQYEDRITMTLSCLKNNFSTIILLLPSKSKLTAFESILNNETDESKYPVLALKNMADVTVLAVEQD